MLERNMVHLNQNDIKTVFKIKLLYNWCCNQDIAHDSFRFVINILIRNERLNYEVFKHSIIDLWQSKSCNKSFVATSVAFSVALSSTVERLRKPLHYVSPNPILMYNGGG